MLPYVLVACCQIRLLQNSQLSCNQSCTEILLLSFWGPLGESRVYVTKMVTDCKWLAGENKERRKLNEETGCTRINGTRTFYSSLETTAFIMRRLKPIFLCSLILPEVGSPGRWLCQWRLFCCWNKLCAPLISVSVPSSKDSSFPSHLWTICSLQVAGYRGLGADVPVQVLWFEEDLYILLLFVHTCASLWSSYQTSDIPASSSHSHLPPIQINILTWQLCLVL